MSMLLFLDLLWSIYARRNEQMESSLLAPKMILSNFDSLIKTNQDLSAL